MHFAMPPVCANMPLAAKPNVRRCFWADYHDLLPFSDVVVWLSEPDLEPFADPLLSRGLMLLAGCWLDGPQSTFDVKGRWRARSSTSSWLRSTSQP